MSSATARRRSLTISGALLVLLAVLSVAVSSGWFNSLDRSVLRAVQNGGGPALDWAMVVVSLLGSAEITFVLLAVIGLLDRGLPSRDRWLPLAFLVVLNLLELAAKLVILHHPPSSHRGIKVGVGVITPGGFPSGHVLRATFVYGLIAQRTRADRRALVWLLVAVFLLVLGFGRVYLGDHWPDDVIGGALLGGAGLAAYLGARRAR